MPQTGSSLPQDSLSPITGTNQQQEDLLEKSQRTEEVVSQNESGEKIDHGTDDRFQYEGAGSLLHREKLIRMAMTPVISREVGLPQ